MNIDKMTLAELTNLNKAVEAALPVAKAREAADLHAELSKMASDRGFKLGELFGAKSVLASRRGSARFIDPKTGVTWSGRGRIPRNFDRSRSQPA